MSSHITLMKVYLKTAFNRLLTGKRQPVEDSHSRQLRLKFDTLKFWTPELIEWIGKENDPIKLACTADLVNRHEWPDYLPSKPDNYMDFKGEAFSLLLHFCCDLVEMLAGKANHISPGLYDKIRLTNYCLK